MSSYVSVTEQGYLRNPLQNFKNCFNFEPSLRPKICDETFENHMKSTKEDLVGFFNPYIYLNPNFSTVFKQNLKIGEILDQLLMYVTRILYVNSVSICNKHIMYMTHGKTKKIN